MSTATVSYTDRKGEAGAIEFNIGTFDPDAFVSDFCPMSYAGFTEWRATTVEDLEDPPEVIATALVNNDKDFKAILGFQGAEGHFKVSIPCPKINIEGGIIIRWGSERAFIPPVKVAGEIGNDGAELAAKMESILGLDADSVKFVYGRLIKKS
jgi:hypothetical protein